VVTARLTGGLLATIDVAEAPVEALTARRKGAPAQRVNRSGVLQRTPPRAHRTMKDWELVARIDRVAPMFAAGPRARGAAASLTSRRYAVPLVGAEIHADTERIVRVVRHVLE
jgi:hypothetical protein